MHRFRPNQVLLLLLVALCTLSAFAGEAYTYQGQMGYSASFPLIGGHYQIYVNAHFVPGFASNRNNCVFGGNFQQVWPKHDQSQLGPGVPITGAIHYNLGPKSIDLDAGAYALYVASATNCRWRFTLVSDNNNPAGLSAIQSFRVTSEGLVLAGTTSMKEKVHFLAQYRTDHDAKMPVSGEMQIWQGGKMLDHFPLGCDADPETNATRCHVTITWEPDKDQRILGKDTARFVVEIGGKQFTQSADFTLTR